MPYTYALDNGDPIQMTGTTIDLENKTYDSITVYYRLTLDNFTEETANQWLDLTGQLSEEAAEQKKALDRLSADGVYNNMGMLNKTMLSGLNGMISGTTLHDDADKNIELQAYFTGVVNNIIQDCVDTDNNLRIYNMLTIYRNTHNGGLKYYYQNSEALIEEINYLSQYLTEMLADAEKEEALVRLMTAANYGSYVEKIESLEVTMAEVKDALIAPNPVIDTESAALGNLVDALNMDGEAGTSTGSYPYLDSEPFKVAAPNKVILKLTVNVTGKTTATNTFSSTYDLNHVVVDSDVMTLTSQAEEFIESVLGNKEQYYDSDYTSADLTVLVGQGLSGNKAFSYTWTPKEYTVKIEGTADQIVSIDNLIVTLPKAEPGYRYDYAVEGSVVEVYENQDGSYTFTTPKNCTITYTKVNLADAKLEKMVATLNSEVGKNNAFVLNGDTLTANIAMSDLMGMVNGMMKSGYGYIGLNDEHLMYSVENAQTGALEAEVSLQTLMNAMLSDETFTEQTLIDLADNGKGTLVTTTLQLGNGTVDDDLEIVENLTFVINLTSVPSQLNSVAGLLKKMSSYITFQANDGAMDVTASMPEEFYDIYLTALSLTGEVDLTDLNAVDTAVAYEFLEDQIKVMTGEGVDSTTYVKTLKKLGREDLLAGYENYVDMLLEMLDGSFTYDDEAENYALSLKATKDMLNKVLAVFGGDNLGSLTGLIKEMKDGAEPLTIPVTAVVSNFHDENAEADRYEAFIMNQGSLNASGLMDKLTAVNCSTGLSADLANSSGFNLVILQKDLGDAQNPITLTIDEDTNAYLDLNGKTFIGDVIVNGKLTLIDSTLDTVNAGGIEGTLSGNDITVISGKYTSDVSAYLKDGYVQDENGVVSNKLYTMSKQTPMALRRTADEIVTVTLNADVLKDSSDLSESMAKAVALDLVSDLLMNYYTAASLSFGQDDGGNSMNIYDVQMTELLSLYAGENTAVEAVNKALDCLDEGGLKNFINQVIVDMTDFETIADGDVIASYDITTKGWKIAIEEVNGAFDASITSGDVAKNITLNIEIGGTNEDVITDLAAELAKIVTSDIKIDTLEEIEYVGNNVTLQGTGHANVTVDMTKNTDYAAIIAIALAYSGANEAEFVDALNNYFETGLTEEVKAAFDKVTVADVIEALKDLNTSTDLEGMIAAIGLDDVADNSDEKTAELEEVYHAFLVVAGDILNYLNIAGPSTKMSALETTDGIYVADKENIGRNGTYAVAKGKGIAYDLEMTSVSLTVKLFVDPNAATAAVEKADNLTYTGNAQKLLISGTATNGTMMYSLDETTWSEDIPEGMGAKDYTVYYYAKGDKTYKDSAEGSVVVSIGKAAPVVTVPKAKNPTLQEGTAQALIDAGSAKGVDGQDLTMEYSLDNTNWSTAIPTGVEAKTYTVYYKVIGGDNHTNVTGQLFATIKAAGTTGGGGGGGGAVGGSDDEVIAPELNKEDHVEIFSGYPDGTFRPEKAMTRAEAAVVFSKLLKEPMEEGKTYATDFTDVEEGKWYSNAIGFMVEQGILSGYKDNTFRPDQEITRAEFATIATKFEELTVDGDFSFSDVPETSWAYTFINFAAERGYVSGYADGTFRPGKSITREEVATVLCKVLEREADKEYIKAHADEVTHFSDVEEKDWSYWFILEATNGHEYTKADNVETWTEIK